LASAAGQAPQKSATGLGHALHQATAAGQLGLDLLIKLDIRAFKCVLSKGPCGF
jgi:hypothetical protein